MIEHKLEDLCSYNLLAHHFIPRLASCTLLYSPNLVYLVQWECSISSVMGMQGQDLTLYHSQIKYVEDVERVFSP